MQHAAPGIRDHVGEVMGDQVGERGEQVGVLAGVRAVIQDPGARGHRVHGLDVQRLLGRPAVRATARGLVVPVGRGDM